MSREVELSDKRLKDLIKAFKGKLPKARVGILGDKNGRTGGGETNAETGAQHEFGSDKLPIRSFLRMPLTEHLEQALEKSPAFDQTVLAQVVKSKSIEPWVRGLAITAEAVVLEAFATEGFGKWKTSNMANKLVHQTLVETGQLRNSITSEVTS